VKEVTAHYEAGSGIRPPHKGGKVRGVAHEIVPGGGMELWHCDHDHAPGVKDCRKLTAEQRADAAACAEAHLRAEISAGRLPDMPIGPVE
jgi:hypothetical protein